MIQERSLAKICKFDGNQYPFTSKCLKVPYIYMKFCSSFYSCPFFHFSLPPRLSLRISSACPATQNTTRPKTGIRICFHSKDLGSHLCQNPGLRDRITSTLRGKNVVLNSTSNSWKIANGLLQFPFNSFRL